MCPEGSVVVPYSRDLSRVLRPIFIGPGALKPAIREKGTGGAVFVTSWRPHCQGDVQSDRGYAAYTLIDPPAVRTA